MVSASVDNSHQKYLSELRVVNRDRISYNNMFELEMFHFL